MMETVYFALSIELYLADMSGHNCDHPLKKHWILLVLLFVFDIQGVWLLKKDVLPVLKL